MSAKKVHFRVRDIETAEEALEYFNALHDGFLRRIKLQSADIFEARGVHNQTGVLTLSILFAHYNYGAGSPPADQEVLAVFKAVKELEISIDGRPHEWSIKQVIITEVVRTHERAGELDCLRLLIEQSRYDDEQGWSSHPDISFTFTKATFEEL